MILVAGFVSTNPKSPLAGRARGWAARAAAGVVLLWPSA